MNLPASAVSRYDAVHAHCVCVANVDCRGCYLEYYEAFSALSAGWVGSQSQVAAGLHPSGGRHERSSRGKHTHSRILLDSVTAHLRNYLMISMWATPLFAMLHAHCFTCFLGWKVRVCLTSCIRHAFRYSCENVRHFLCNVL